MKHLFSVLLYLMFVLPGVARDNGSSLIVRGVILETVNVDYDICLIKEDGSCESIKKDGAIKFYRFNLEIGREYEITFTKGNFTKVLYIKADAPGIFPMDVDFGSPDNALLSYNYSTRRYQLKRLDDEEYTAQY